MCTHFLHVPQLPSALSSAAFNKELNHHWAQGDGACHTSIDLCLFQVVELKPGGKDIPVTTANRIAYIHLVADYRLNKQIRAHCLAFRQGLANVVNLEWLRMFDQQEIQVAAYLCAHTHA